MAAWQAGLALAGMLLWATDGSAQTYNLSEESKPGESFRISMETSLAGLMKVKKDDRKADIRISATNEHRYVEKVLAVERGVSRKNARFYEKAVCGALVADEKIERTLRNDRKLIVAQRTTDSLLCYSPAGPLTRSELEVVAEHFDTLHLTGLLPGKVVAIEDTWKITNHTAQSICLFDGLIEQDLTATLKEVQDGAAIVRIEGKASGIELGAMVKLEIDATLRYDLLTHRIRSLDWKQKDQRDQGPVSPASEVETTTKLKRDLLTEEPKELSKTALVGVPTDDDPPGILKQLAYTDAKGRFNFLYPRQWHTVGQTDNHVILRLVERGDFVAQATITHWKKAAPGKHLESDEFKKLAAESPGWAMEEVVESGEIPTDAGRWIYRIAARGELDGIRVLQNFFALAGPQGDQVIVSVTMKPTSAAKIGTKDVGLVNAIDFPKK